ncbi:MAG TPA: response regulator [Thermomicrobiales bacterium]
MPERVLIVEDDYVLRETLRELLELEGYSVTTAADGIEGLDRFGEGATVVILDLNMPRLDGFGFAVELERRGLREDVALLILTSDFRAWEKAARIGAEAWLAKPFDASHLLDLVAQLASRQSRQA